jgi:hypothetical protein
MPLDGAAAMAYTQNKCELFEREFVGRGERGYETETFKDKTIAL